MKLAMRFLGNLAFAIAASLGAALILLAGLNAVLGFGMLGLVFAFTLVKTAINLILIFLVCIIVSVVAIGTILRITVCVASRRIGVVKRLRIQWAQRLVRKAVLRLRTFSRTQPREKQSAALAETVLGISVVLLVVYLFVRDANSWNAILSVRLPRSAPVGRVGRSEAPLHVARLADVANYVNARHDKVAATLNEIAPLLSRGDQPLNSRCGSVFPLQPAETRRIAELYTDLTEAPPILKREYILTEDQLTATLSSILIAQSSRTTVDCVKLNRNHIRLFTTSLEDDGSKQNYAFGMSVVKDAGSLRMVLDELSIGGASFQIGWLGLGITGGLDEIAGDTEGADAEVMRVFDSRIYSISVSEGYMRIVTWRLPSAIAARAAIDVGYTQQDAEQRVEPRDDAARLGAVCAGDLVYVLERTDEWLYVCSEASGRFGWLPKAAFTSLGDSSMPSEK